MVRAGVPFRMHHTGVFVVLLCLAIGFRIGGWQLGLPAGALLLASLLLHEAGHMFAARSLGVPVREFGLRLGRTYVKRAHAVRHRDEILIAASGPLMNFLLVIPFIFVPRFGLQLATCNLALGLMNLLPLPSSDGLRIVRNLLGGIGTSATNPALSVVSED
jgi:Zn-dependent protease